MMMTNTLVALLTPLQPLVHPPWASSSPGAQLMHRPLPLVHRCTSPVCASSQDSLEYAFAFEEDEDDVEEDDDPMVAMEGALTDRPASNLTVAELQAQLKQLGQRHTGTKNELMERIQLMQRKRALGLPIHDMQVKREDGMQWYMLQTANGFERAVERTINMMIKAQRLESKIEVCAKREKNEAHNNTLVAFFSFWL